MVVIPFYFFPETEKPFNSAVDKTENREFPYFDPEKGHLNGRNSHFGDIQSHTMSGTLYTVY